MALWSPGAQERPDGPIDESAVGPAVRLHVPDDLLVNCVVNRDRAMHLQAHDARPFRQQRPA